MHSNIPIIYECKRLAIAREKFFFTKIFFHFYLCFVCFTIYPVLVPSHHPEQSDDPTHYLTKQTPLNYSLFVSFFFVIFIFATKNEIICKQIVCFIFSPAYFSYTISYMKLNLLTRPFFANAHINPDFVFLFFFWFLINTFANTLVCPLPHQQRQNFFTTFPTLAFTN